jgi:hypothetical protein
MSLATHSQLSSDAVSRESEQNLSVSCLNRLRLAFANNRQIQNSGSGSFANSQGIVITGGTYVVVSLSCGLHKQLIIAHILFARTISYLPILEKGV